MLSVAASTNTGTRVVSAEEMEALAVGAWILGTGGGGDPYQKLLNMRQLYKKGYSVSLLDPMYLDDDDRVAVVSGMGAPLVGQERLADPHFAVKPVRMMEEYCGARFRAVMALEIGGGNGLQPFMVAALTGLPVVDADSMGRAYPEAQMTSFAANDLPMYPLAVADIRDNEVIVTRAASATWVERLSRKVVVEMGSTAATCKTPRRGSEVKDHGILYTVSKAIRLGEVVLRARRQHDDVIGAVLQETAGKRMFTGKVVDVERRTTAGSVPAGANTPVQVFSSKPLSAGVSPNACTSGSVSTRPAEVTPSARSFFCCTSGVALVVTSRPRSTWPPMTSLVICAPPR